MGVIMGEVISKLNMPWLRQPGEPRHTRRRSARKRSERRGDVVPPPERTGDSGETLKQESNYETFYQKSGSGVFRELRTGLHHDEVSDTSHRQEKNPPVGADAPRPAPFFHPTVKTGCAWVCDLLSGAVDKLSITPCFYVENLVEKRSKSHG